MTTSWFLQVDIDTWLYIKPNLTHSIYFSVVPSIPDLADSDDDELEFADPDEVTFNVRGQYQPGQSPPTDLDDTLPWSTSGGSPNRYPGQSAPTDLNDTLPGSTMGNIAADDGEDDAYTISDQLRAILPEDWDAGEDGMGAISSHEAENSMYRKPWQFSNDSIRAMTRLTKVEFFRFVESSIGSRTRENRHLNLWSECLMFLLKIAHDTPYQMLGTMFEVDPQLAHTVVYRQVLHQYFNHTNIPCIINADGSVNQAELSKMFQSAHANTPEFFKQLTFEDPLNLGRIGVYLNIDATYLFTQNSMDVEMQKSLFCAFKAGHLIKWLTITDLRGKVQGQCPASTSNTPASGDKSIVARYIALEEDSPLGQYIRAIMRGNDQFFPIWVVDAGFVARVPNAPRETRDLDGLTELSDQEGCIVIHTSNVENTYHLGENDRGELIKVDRDPDRPTLDEVAVMFTRKLRKIQEMSFGV